MYANLISEMKAHGVTQQTMSDALGIHANSIWRKLNGQSDFTVNELIEIRRQFFPKYTLDYLSQQADATKK